MEYHKCCNPDCLRMAKRHMRCSVCRRFKRYFCQTCKCELDTDRAVHCVDCRYKKVLKYQRGYGKEYYRRKVAAK